MTTERSALRDLSSFGVLLSEQSSDWNFFSSDILQEHIREGQSINNVVNYALLKRKAENFVFISKMKYNRRAKIIRKEKRILQF